MKKIANLLIFLGGVIVLAVAAYGELVLKTWPGAPFWMVWAVKAADSLGLGVVIAVVASKAHEWVSSAVAEAGPKVEIITAARRCERLTQCVLENPKARLLTTRYSARAIGDTEKSRQFLRALDFRIHGRAADTFRVVTLDHTDKLTTAHAMLAEHYLNPRFGLKVLDPKNLRLIDLMVSEGHFACLGIETRNPEENYWIRVDDPIIANEFRDYYENDHWNRPEAVEIKRAGIILDNAGLKAAQARLNDEAKKAGVTVS